jgi:hypothetical protein
MRRSGSGARTRVLVTSSDAGKETGAVRAQNRPRQSGSLVLKKHGEPERNIKCKWRSATKSCRMLFTMAWRHEPRWYGPALRVKVHEKPPTILKSRIGTIKPCSRQCELADPSLSGDLRRFTTAVTEARFTERSALRAVERPQVVPAREIRTALLRSPP